MEATQGEHEEVRTGLGKSVQTEREVQVTKSVLQEAEEIINGERRDAYGPAEESFQRIATMWSVILKREVTSHQVALCMIAFKICREINKPKRDNLVDIAGYTALAEKVAP